jgi:hypothetical protein
VCLVTLLAVQGQRNIGRGLTSRDSAADNEHRCPLALHQHQRQPQREEPTHDDHGDEAHRAEGLALNVGDVEQEAPSTRRQTGLCSVRRNCSPDKEP